MYESAMVERTALPDREDRARHLESAGYNLFNIPSDAVYVDLLTDSGTGTMSTEQWAALLGGDESYAGSESFEQLEAAVADVMGFQNVVPAHQGRAAEHLLYGAILDEDDVVIANTHFDTTRAHVENAGAEPVDCPHPEAWTIDADVPFRGNLAVGQAREVADEVGHDRVPAIIVTITNNSAAGQPVSIENCHAARELADDLDARLVIDACRFAENAAFVNEREAGWADASIGEIVSEQLSVGDAVIMSGKKDGLVNAGGFVAVADEESSLFEQLKQRAILYEGFPTYGGMAGRDMAAMAAGLREATDPEYLDHRLGQVRRLTDALDELGVPVAKPSGGHAVYVDAGRMLPSIPGDQFPGQALACALYLEGAVRTVELGSFAFPDTERPELVRLALPRRRYHREHLDHIVETFAAVRERADEITGYEVVDEPEMASLRHFSADLLPVATE